MSEQKTKRSRRAAETGRRDGKNEAAEMMMLAAYLDGTLDEAERSEAEALLARDPDALEIALAARGALLEAAGPAPDSLVARASSLVPAEGPSIWTRLAGLFDAGRPVWQPAGWTGAVAAVALACLMGFELGRTGLESALVVDELLAQEIALGFDQSDDDFL